ncbi:hypothetical protein Mmc1_0283 [Magnetococcus marinus MC-1]|uniref:Uncharacterized protein n=1 Tax=Magnetococcus marinus (strain ATCC BAA-1437 / JCM 17883 / MC-1) TaxID=156889 RepID=A0L4B7_MAGMM|nr:hypothetical protein [Magnetococcus marinus]ABK42810.1 hypothetical protein Mmc1_0283 [Magnetococcus marinus MC-1]
MKSTQPQANFGFNICHFESQSDINSDIYDTMLEIRRDDLFEIGTVRAWCFPPRGAPTSVHRAWDMAVNMLSDEDADRLAARFYKGTNLMGFPLPGLTTDAGTSNHGSYRAWTRQLMAELSRTGHARADFDEQHALLELFLWALTACDAP